MSEKTVSFQDLYNALNEFRKETNTRFDDLEKQIDDTYATKEELKTLDDKYNPVKDIVYGAVKLILVTVTLAVLGLVVVNTNLIGK